MNFFGNFLHYKNLPILSTTSLIEYPSVISSIASFAFMSGEISLLESSESLFLISSFNWLKSISFASLFSNSSFLLFALSSMLAVKNILSSASGKTVLPMSLPSATRPPDSPIFLCSSTRYFLISFIEEIFRNYWIYHWWTNFFSHTIVININILSNVCIWFENNRYIFKKFIQFIFFIDN